LIAARYAEAFADVPGVSLQPEATWGIHSRWLSVIYLDPELVATQPGDIVRQLDAVGIEARPVWRPMHLQPLFAEAQTIGGATAERLFRTGLCLPSSSSLTAEQQARVIDALRSALDRPH
jgi:dTDP-4-amino-4,6-dideoxygalactose transaminase